MACQERSKEEQQTDNNYGCLCMSYNHATLCAGNLNRVVTQATIINKMTNFFLVKLLVIVPVKCPKLLVKELLCVLN